MNKDEPVIVAIRDTEKSEDNPYSVRQRRAMIKRAFGSRVKVIVIPDISKIAYGRAPGYEIEQIRLGAETEKISGTGIRKLSQTHHTVWFTGLPKAGKTTLATSLKKKLDNDGFKVRLFDGDSVRKSLWGDLKFSKPDRIENMRRVVHLCEAYSKLNIITIVALISPYRSARDATRARLKNFIEVYVKCPLKICESRDTTGMYRKAHRGKIENFTGISDPYEEPLNPEVVCETDKISIKDCVNKVLEALYEKSEP